VDVGQIGGTNFVNIVELHVKLEKKDQKNLPSKVQKFSHRSLFDLNALENIFDVMGFILRQCVKRFPR
jgi:hypothetical protein